MRYSVGQIWLHWISAVVILWTLFSGFYVAFIDVAMETKNWVGFINVSLSALYIPIFILRVYFSFRPELASGVFMLWPMVSSTSANCLASL